MIASSGLCEVLPIDLLVLNQVTSYRIKSEETPGIPCVDGVLMNVKAIDSIHHGGISSESFTEYKATDEGTEASD